MWSTSQRCALPSPPGSFSFTSRSIRSASRVAEGVNQSKAFGIWCVCVYVLCKYWVHGLTLTSPEKKKKKTNRRRQQ